MMANLSTLIIFAKVVEANSFSETAPVVHGEVY
jgi:hypothetical protein